MTFTETHISGLWIIEPKVFADDRGYFTETYKKVAFEESIGKIDFIQENESRSSYGVIRGLHFQLPPFAQSKLVRVVHGSVLDVAVDLRPDSPTFGQHVAVELSSDNKKQLFIPQGFAHGFQVISDYAIFTYKVDNPYAPNHEASLRYNDPSIGIEWRKILETEHILSSKDADAPLLEEIKSKLINSSPIK